VVTDWTGEEEFMMAVAVRREDKVEERSAYSL
jgi:hypothetical protein